MLCILHRYSWQGHKHRVDAVRDSYDERAANSAYVWRLNESHSCDAAPIRRQNPMRRVVLGSRSPLFLLSTHYRSGYCCSCCSAAVLMRNHNE